MWTVGCVLVSSSMRLKTCLAVSQILFINIVAQCFSSPWHPYLSTSHQVFHILFRLWGHRSFNKHLHTAEVKGRASHMFFTQSCPMFKEGCAVLCTTYNFHTYCNTSHPQIFWLFNLEEKHEKSAFHNLAKSFLRLYSNICETDYVVKATKEIWIITL